MNLLDRIVSYPAGAIVILAFAALLEALGDSFFQVSFYRSSGVERVLWFVGGGLVLECGERTYRWLWLEP